jgi:hypothetical protein
MLHADGQGLFVGIDWGGSHHQLCVVDAVGVRRRQLRLAHDVAGLAELDRELAAVSGELPVAQEPSLLVDGGGVVSAAMGVNAADDNPGALGHAGTAFPLGHEPGQARTGRAGGHTSDKACRTSSYQVTPARPVACTFTRPCRAGRQLPG